VIRCPMYDFHSLPLVFSFILPHRKGFGIKWRWIVERTFAWLSTWRRLAKDYEVLPSSEEAWIYLAMSRIMLRRLAQNSS
jgi:hypothetical protein